MGKRSEVSPADEVRRARRRAKLSISALARALGVPRSTVQRWERGLCQPSAQHYRDAMEIAGAPDAGAAA